ncbi:hypothetical protein CBS101457_002605 [Exobasidium rhododendri]|nr:hypothetical protein CBS101457_002605 [Exobasidium rhododendri]
MSTNTQGRGSYSEAIAALNTLQSNASVIEAIRKSGGKLNDFAIPEMVEYLERIGWKTEDLNRLNVIHITGTKGKGSTSAFVDSLVRSTPLKMKDDNLPTVGLYTSPHLVQVRERIRLDGKPISEALFAKYFWQVWDRLQQNERRANPDVTPVRPVYFRYLTILAYHIFLTLQVKCTILEVGIGGRYDSTNIVPKPIVTGITTLGLDHTALLGNTIEEIAYQKAGIFKPGCPAVSVSQSKGAERVLQKEASNVGTSSYLLLPGLSDSSPVQSVKLGIPGAHQKSNALLAVELYRTFLRSSPGRDHFEVHPPPSSSTSTDTLTEVEQKGLRDARWPGRCQTVRSKGTSRAWFLDGAHTTESLESCAAWFVQASREVKKGEKRFRRALIFNTTHDRKSEELLAGMMEAVGKELSTAENKEEGTTVANYFDRAIFCTNSTYKDGVSAGDLTAVAGEISLDPQKNMQAAWKKVYPSSTSTVLPSIQDAIEEIQGSDIEHVLVCGSLHLIGGVMSHLKEANLLDESLNGVC